VIGSRRDRSRNWHPGKDELAPREDQEYPFVFRRERPTAQLGLGDVEENAEDRCIDEFRSLWRPVPSTPG